ncbi:AAA family ATPase [Streptomyces sp. NPDC048507]|uniref:AAA family ATPase n=1 Tax=Streptomyces sp. NPDC048507 TaxID=3365560 RepID=UPI0037213279
MSLRRMALTNYRCFADSEDIELAPLTVILGRNNSGKSALVRAPLVIGTGIRTESPIPLDLDELPEDILDSFTDLVYGNRPHGGISMDLEISGASESTVQVSAAIQNIDECMTQVVSKFELAAGGVRTVLTWDLKDPINPTYDAVHDGAELGPLRVRFHGIIPIGFEPVAGTPEESSFLEFIEGMGSAVRENYPVVRYVGPFRERPHRRYRLPGRMPSDVGISGEFAAGILASDIARNNRSLIRQVNLDLADNLPGWSVDVVERGGLYSVVLKSESEDGLEVNLADSGTGVAQVLPLFVQRALDMLSPPESPVLEIVEQPELHLHPAAHGPLADLYLTAVQRSKVRFIVETHSETFLLRLRRRIAEGMPAANVTLFFVEHAGAHSRTRRINIAQDGSLDFWPEGVFSEDYEEARALAAAQLERRANL